MSDTEEKEKTTDSADPNPTPVDPTPKEESHPAAEAEAPEVLESLEINEEPQEKFSLKELLHSSDSPSRYLTLLSLLFGIAALVCLTLLVTQYMKRRHAEQKPPAVVEKPKSGTAITENLGEFAISWTNAELRAELVAECTNQEACENLKRRKAEARDLTIPILEASSRDEILNPDKKLLVRRKIAEKLNEMKLGGKVLEVDFYELSVEVSH